jgi:hypothetical protein
LTRRVAGNLDRRPFWQFVRLLKKLGRWPLQEAEVASA